MNAVLVVADLAALLQGALRRRYSSCIEPLVNHQERPLISDKWVPQEGLVIA